MAKALKAEEGDKPTVILADEFPAMKTEDWGEVWRDAGLEKPAIYVVAPLGESFTAMYVFESCQMEDELRPLSVSLKRHRRSRPTSKSTLTC